MNDLGFRPKSIAMQEFEHRLGRDIAVVLQEAYDELGTQRLVAARLDLDPSTVARWMKDLGIKARRQGRRAEATA